MTGSSRGPGPDAGPGLFCWRANGASGREEEAAALVLEQVGHPQLLIPASAKRMA